MKHNLHHRCTAHATLPSPRGLTLMELLLVLGIVAALMGAVLSLVTSTVQHKKVVEASSRGDLVGPKILEMMRRDLEAVFIYNLDALAEDEETGTESGGTGADAEGAEGTSGGSDFSRQDVNFFVGEDRGDEEDSEDRLMFVTSLDSFLRVGARQSDIAEVGYYLEDGDHCPEGCHILYRREDFHLDRDPIRGGSAIKLCDRVVGLSFRYYERPETIDDQEDLAIGTEDPIDDWDNTEKEGLPVAVEITVWIDITDDPDNLIPQERRTVRRYRTIVLLPDYPSREQLSEATDETEGNTNTNANNNAAANNNANTNAGN